ncbi:MAG TPA: hypothetical protein VGB37_12695 [Candidatus Lokiarchaeia archaeon]
MVKKHYLIKAINFGKKGELAREIVEHLEKKVGKSKLSKHIRNSVIAYFSTNKEFNQMKINQLLNERKELQSQIPNISNMLLDNERKLNELGYKL